MSERIRFELSDMVATITLDRPEKLNALDPEMLRALEGHLDRLDTTNEARVLIVTGAGERAFCVGADIAAWASLEPIDMWRSWVRTGYRVFDRLARLRIPTIAGLNGFTLGGGLELALACDLRIAAEGVQLGAPEVKIGTVPGWGGTQRLPRLIGVARAKQLVFTGERVSDHQAERWGLVNEVVARDNLLPRCRELAESIAANAPIAVQLAKSAIDGGLGDDLGRTLEAVAGALAGSTADGREGVASFREKRPAEYVDG